MLVLLASRTVVVSSGPSSATSPGGRRLLVFWASGTVVVWSGPSSAAAGPGPRRPAAPTAEAAATKPRRVCIVRIGALPSVARRPSGVHLARGSSRSYPFVPAAVSPYGAARPVPRGGAGQGNGPCARIAASPPASQLAVRLAI